MKIKKDIPLLKVLTKLKGEDFKAMVDTLSDDSVDNVCECVYNLIYNPSLKIASRKKTHLRKFIKSKCSIHRLKNIADKKQPLFKRRQILKQEGRGLPFLLASAIPFLISLFGKK
jgi:hypothetical protein